MPKRRSKQNKVGFAVAKDKLDWLLSKTLGDRGEAVVLAFFEENRIPYRRFKVPDAISNASFAKPEQRINFTREFKRDLLVDALARIDGVTYAVEVKTKNSTTNFVVDVADYDPLFHEFQPVIPVLVYFYMKPSREIFVHNLRNPKAPPPLQTTQQQGEAVYRIPSSELRKVTEVAVQY